VKETGATQMLSKTIEVTMRCFVHADDCTFLNLVEHHGKESKVHCRIAGKRIRRYWTTACQNCSFKSPCRTGRERRIPRWEHEHLLEAVQRRLDANPEAMRQGRETVEHPFRHNEGGMGATHFLTKTLPKVAAEMALSVLVYNLTRVLNLSASSR
jgi:hypothetical protein